MKRYVILLVCILVNKAAAAQEKTHHAILNLPDTVKAVSLISVPKITPGQRQTVAGIKANGMEVSLASGKKRFRVSFDFPAGGELVAKGLNVKERGLDKLYWHFKPNAGNSYRLLIVSTGDSAENFTLYSGYIYFSSEQQWKLIGTCKMAGEYTMLKGPVSLISIPGQSERQPSLLANIWYQRSNGSWKSVSATDTIPPVLLPFSNTDSIRQFTLEKKLLEKDIAARNTDAKAYKDGVYYTMLREGSGQPVSVTDTVSVFYKGYLYANGKTFDETKEKPARFPLNRLIKGWQTGLPLCRVGGKIKLVLLSGQAYSIRTRAAKIPPNSILVFEIEVVEAKRK